jgi:hypothetical protein
MVFGDDVRGLHSGLDTGSHCFFARAHQTRCIHPIHPHHKIKASPYHSLTSEVNLQDSVLGDLQRHLINFEPPPTYLTVSGNPFAVKTLPYPRRSMREAIASETLARLKTTARPHQDGTQTRSPVAKSAYHGISSAEEAF